MAELKSNFENLVSQMSDSERKNLLDKMRPLEGDPSNRSLANVQGPDEDFLSLEEGLKNESLFYKFYLWLRSVFSSSSVQSVYNEDKVIAIYKKLDRQTPGLLDYKNGLFLTGFYEKLEELKKAAEFFKPYIDAIYDDIGLYYVFMGSVIAPEITEQMDSDVDPGKLPLNRDVTGELRTSLIRKMEEILKNIPQEKRAYLYSCVLGIEWLRQFTNLKFQKFSGSFANGLSDSLVAKFELVTGVLGNFSKVLCNPQNIPEEAFESIYLYTVKKVLPEKKSEEEGSSPEADFMDKANSHMSIIRMFISSVPMRRVCRVVYNNSQWQPENFGGAEDWFVKFKDQWKKLFDEKWNAWLREKKKDKMHTQLTAHFGLENFPLLPCRPWTNLLGGTVFHFEMTAGFLAWFADNKAAKVIAPLKTLLLEGVFINNDNRGELANTLNDISSFMTSMSAFLESLSDTGQTGLLFEKIASEHVRTLQIQQKIDSKILEHESQIQNMKNQFCNSSRSFINILNGVTGEHKDTRYDGIQNYTIIGGNNNLNFRQELKDSCEVFGSALDMLKELESIDLPGSLSSI